MSGMAVIKKCEPVSGRLRQFQIRFFWLKEQVETFPTRMFANHIRARQTISSRTIRSGMGLARVILQLSNWGVWHPLDNSVKKQGNAVTSQLRDLDK